MTRSLLNAIAFTILLAGCTPSRTQPSDFSTSIPNQISVNGIWFSPEKLLSAVSDSSFGGTYLNIEKVVADLRITRLQAYEIQNLMRDELIVNTGSFSALAHKRYATVALINAVHAVLVDKINEGHFKPLNYKKNEFVVVLDLDETLLVHWYQAGIAPGSLGRGTFGLTVRDSALDLVDRKTGTSKPKATILYSPNKVQLRPGFHAFFTKIMKLKGFQGFVFFTAKEDESAWDIHERMKTRYPDIFQHVLGFYTRNYLLFDGTVTKPSKDLRMFDPTLKHVILIDDNESRVLQPNFNFRIPKFNADLYLAHRHQDETDPVRILNEKLLSYVADLIVWCATDTDESGEQIGVCFNKRMGSLSQNPNAELSKYYEDLTEKGHNISLTLEQIHEQGVFHQPFTPAFTRFPSEKFPSYTKWVMQD